MLTRILNVLFMFHAYIFLVGLYHNIFSTNYLNYIGGRIVYYSLILGMLWIPIYIFMMFKDDLLN